MVLAIATGSERAQTHWEPALTATERDCLLLGRLVDRTHLVLKEAQTSTSAARDDTAKLLRAISGVLAFGAFCALRRDAW